MEIKPKLDSLVHIANSVAEQNVRGYIYLVWVSISIGNRPKNFGWKNDWIVNSQYSLPIWIWNATIWFFTLKPAWIFEFLNFILI